jgi:alpha-tubulin suppressor-like RCC1 family protein
MAIKADGTLWGCGMWSGGKMGIGEYPGSHNNPNPTRAGTDSDWTGALVSCGYNHTVAVKTDGSLWVWGTNDWAQLGNGTVGGDYAVVPTRLGTGNDWKAAAASYNHSVAVKADGSVWTWGTNEYGQLGIGNTALRNAPVQVAETDYVAVAAGWGCSYALKGNGELWAWGLNGYYQVGIGTTDNQLVPVKVDGGFRVPGK